MRLVRRQSRRNIPIGVTLRAVYDDIGGRWRSVNVSRHADSGGHRFGVPFASLTYYVCQRGVCVCFYPAQVYFFESAYFSCDLFIRNVPFVERDP